MKIGLPRGLLYHSYGPFMEAFLSELPAEIIISEETDRDILDRGTAACIDDACLPVKVYAGHVESLREKCDRIVVPRIMSCEYGESLCPKLNGLPELIALAVVTGLHLWKGNVLLSIGVGTAVYMVLVQAVFV